MSQARATIDLLKDTLGDRLISRFGPVNWPTRSCDLTPLDYFLWGYVKSLVYADKPQTLHHLEDNIRRVIADIRPQMLEKVIENWTSRLDYMRASRGSPMPEIIFKMRLLGFSGRGSSLHDQGSYDLKRKFKDVLRHGPIGLGPKATTSEVLSSYSRLGLNKFMIRITSIVKCYSRTYSLSNCISRSTSVLSALDGYIRLFPIYDTFLCAAISKTIPKALECNKMTLAVFAKDLLILEKTLCVPFLFPLKHAYMKNGGIGEEIA
ncbi:uncharacterized protein TNCV_1900221 [Trichonephila clavipes]|nr:uncharacterized protein TNCV_1900221 [Trichonephila clavipes]